MSTHRPTQPVTQADQVLDNIRRFAEEVERTPELQRRLGQVHAWYVAPADDGSWVFAPSKFVGYRSNSSQHYLATYNVRRGANGGETEARLKQWFDVVDPDTRLGRELSAALVEFLARWERKPREGFRINLLSSQLDEHPRSSQNRNSSELSARITSDPAVCSGRPCIRGTRVRVSDVLDMLAHGAERSEIIADYPYISEEDIAAALHYAARAADHRVIRAA